MTNAAIRKIEALLESDEILDLMTNPHILGGTALGNPFARMAASAQLEHPGIENAPLFDRFKIMSKEFGLGEDVNGPTESRSTFGWGFNGDAPDEGPTVEANYYRNPTPENKELFLKNEFQTQKSNNPDLMVQDAVYKASHAK
jgi:hypothetical protein